MYIMHVSIMECKMYVRNECKYNGLYNVCMYVM